MLLRNCLKVWACVPSGLVFQPINRGDKQIRPIWVWEMESFTGYRQLLPVNRTSDAWRPPEIGPSHTDGGWQEMFHDLCPRLIPDLWCATWTFVQEERWVSLTQTQNDHRREKRLQSVQMLPSSSQMTSELWRREEQCVQRFSTNTHRPSLTNSSIWRSLWRATCPLDLLDLLKPCPAGVTDTSPLLGLI